ncbi:MAG: hypothetical protein J4G01_08510 [Dehalococcoidia bacterium]|nr:hypothetical protein [Dehalococcoidia bacterium]
MVFVPLHGASAQEVAEVRGEVVNGTEGSQIPTGLEVLLHRFGDEGQIEILSTSTQKDGAFIFTSVEIVEDSTYAVAVNYQDVLYSASVPSPIGTQPVELKVYEVVQDIDAISVDAHAVLVNEGPDEQSLFVLEAVGIVNDGDRTFVPDLEQPVNFNFMRFSLPEGATELDVGSDLPGGEVINIGTGFALTAPVTPGIHQVTYTYQMPYSDGSATIEKSFHMGADRFTVLLREGLGFFAYASLDDGIQAETVDIGGIDYTSWELNDLVPGGRVSLRVSGLPTISWWSRAGETLTEGGLLKIWIPITLVVVLLALLCIGLIASYKRARLLPSGQGSRETQPGSVEDVGNMDEEQLVQRIADLDDLYAQGDMPDSEYKAAREAAKGRLLRLAMDRDDASKLQREEA